MYGIQTVRIMRRNDHMFENDVKMYGIQTRVQLKVSDLEFENDVKMYGIQTNDLTVCVFLCLRMM